MDKIDLGILCTQVCAIARETGEFIKNYSGLLSFPDFESKGCHDYVTWVDREAERQLVDKLYNLFPEAGFITEENTINRAGERYDWIIDPLDGTTNFIHGVPCFSVSIALKDRDNLILGVIYEPNLDECFYTWGSEPAFLNEKIINVSKTTKLSDSLIVTGFPSRNYSRMDAYMELLNDLMFTTHGIRRIGSAAVDLAWVAAGRFECFYEYHLNAWDVAAGALLVKNAGGIVSDFNGGNNFLFGKEIIASNTLIFNEFSGRLKNAFLK